MTPLWIDTDMGFDDMLAIMMIRQSGRAIAGCSLVFGNSTFDRIHANAAGMAALWSWDFAIHNGAARPISGALVTARNILGPSGLPTLGQVLPEAPPLPDRSQATTALAHWLETAPAAVDILALGPITNLGMLLQSRPDLSSRINCITWMGGSATTGNHTAAAEFNAFADPEAAAIVFASSVPVRMVDLDLCRQVTMAPPDLDELRGLNTEKAQLLHDLLGGFITISISKGRPSQPIFDPVAAASIVDSDAVGFEPATVCIDTSDGPMRGQTDVNRCSGGPHRVGTVADAERIRRMAMDAMKAAADL
ncbi:MAG: nucleoside hydrolase [Alphaproteobacteria bacterium]|nr:nucleoside hydrolase [Alphaproteobacteria bacterium]